MLTPIRLRIEGFRGFREAVDFTFDKPVTQLFGENRSGKSSTLNAIEWVLFGDDCCGKQTGIRERVGWTVDNRHMESPVVCVELEMALAAGNCLIRRSMRRRPKKTALESSLQVTFPDGATISGSEAEHRLGGLLRSSFRDFLTTVYQHQESIRAIVTQEPKDRNDAIDRLLGLTDQRNILDALDAAKLAQRQKQVGDRFGNFGQQIQTALNQRQNDVVEARQQAKNAGIATNQLTLKEALERAKAVADAIKEFAASAELKTPDVNIPADMTGLVMFDKAAKTAINGMRGKVPGTAEQTKLVTYHRDLSTLVTELEGAQNDRTALENSVLALEKEHGAQKAILVEIPLISAELELEQSRLRQTNGQAAVIKEAIAFLEKNLEAPCPVCGTMVPDLLETIRRLWTDKLAILVNESVGKINALRIRINSLREVAEQFETLSNKAIKQDIEWTNQRDRVAILLNCKLAVDDAPRALVEVERARIKERLNELEEAIRERHKRLDDIEKACNDLSLIRDYLRHEAKTAVLGEIEKSASFKQLESLRDQIAKLVEDSSQIKTAVAELSREEGEAKLAAAEQLIDDYFRQLSGNPAVQCLKLAITTDKRTNRNSYDISDQDGKDLTPILSQGDLNALALAIFLGLATAGKETGTLGFLILDDPSQSLGTEHKKRLAKLLDRVSQYKKLVIATMDAEFYEHLLATLTKEKTSYRFGLWTPAKGPSISRGPK
ncbi:MAG TPA: SMC family ATPase [Gemmataceae bacterium]|nr:SMC family ATPase [Gemmataceae bacterium]